MKSVPAAVTLFAPSAAATRRLAAVIAAELAAPALIALNGPLGAGKTEFVRGFAEYYGAAESVASPTFVLENIYQVRQESMVDQIFHWDLYRVGAAASAEEIVEALDRQGSVVLVEWADRLPELAAFAGIDLSFEFAGENGRVVHVRCAASQHQAAAALKVVQSADLMQV